MGDKTKIQWTDASWNPIRARSRSGRIGWFCEKVSAGCANCYAAAFNLPRGTGVEFKPGHRENGDVASFLDPETLCQPLRWTRERMIFPCSMTDVFLASHPDAWIYRMMAVMAATPHTYQVLTKRTDRMAEFLSRPPGEIEARMRDAAREIDAENQAVGRRVRVHRPLGPIILPLPNVWWGTSVEDQEAWRERWPALKRTPAAVRFVSFEPLLGHVDVCRDLGMWWNSARQEWIESDASRDRRPIIPDWAIIGGESGNGARTCRLEWIESLVEQLTAAGVSVFVKQLGARVTKQVGGATATVRFADRKGGDPAEWPTHLRIRMLPIGARASMSLL